MTIYFRNFESDDLYDFLKRVERSYALNFDNYDLSAIETVTDFAAFINQHTGKSINGNCSSQQSFYKLREAIAEATRSDPKKIVPSTLLKEALGDTPRKNAFITLRGLGIDTPLLKMNGTVNTFFVFGVLLSLLAIFFFGWYASIVTLLFIASYQAASRFSDIPAFATVGDAAEQLSIENYMRMRRNSNINPMETELVLTMLLLNVLGLNNAKDLVAQGYATAI